MLMNEKLHIFKESLANWDERAKELSKIAPIKTLPHLPNICGITKDTARFLKGKSLWYLLRYDKDKVFLRYFFKRPLHYGFSLLKSYLKKNSYLREGDFFFYGIKTEEEFKQLLEDQKNLLVVGFSYCHKPFECPSGRFSDQCIRDPNHPVCGQCFIGKATLHLPKKNVIPLFIPTIHYIGEKIFEIVHANPDKKVRFLITACEMTLKMFSDWGNMVGVKGIGVRLDGRICNTMKAFKLSEEGIKPGLTVVTEPTKERMLSILSFLQSRNGTTSEKA